MILPLHDALRQSVRETLRERYALEPDAIPPIVIQYPPNRTLGDLAVTVAFELARKRRGKLTSVEAIRSDIRQFKNDNDCDRLVMV